MTKIEFAQLCQDVAEYFGSARQISEQRINLWYAKVHWIPAEALGWITDKLFEDRDSMPVNLPKAIRFWWGQWRDAHPDRRAWEEKIECAAPGCFGGFILMTRPHGDGEYPYTCVAYCDRCAVARRICTEDHPNLNNRPAMLRNGYTLIAADQARLNYERRTASRGGSVTDTVGRVAESFQV